MNHRLNIILSILLVMMISCQKKPDATQTQPAQSENSQLSNTSTTSQQSKTEPIQTTESPTTDAIESSESTPQSTNTAVIPTPPEGLISWTWHDNQWICMNPDGCTYKSDKYPSLSHYQDQQIYCGKLPSEHWQKDYICSPEYAMLRCIADECMCGSEHIQKLDYCQNGIPSTICRNPACDHGPAVKGFNYPLQKILEESPRYSVMYYHGKQHVCGKYIHPDNTFKYEYYCHDGNWLCNEDGGCKCRGNDIDKDDPCNGEIISNYTEPYTPLDLPEEIIPRGEPLNYKLKSPAKTCKNGNCPCGKGACARGDFCMDGKCYCGDKDYIIRHTSKDWQVTITESNDFGEFACNPKDTCGTTMGTATGMYCCERKDGCTTTLTKQTIPFQLCIVPPQYYSDDNTGFHPASEMDIDVFELDYSGYDLSDDDKTMMPNQYKPEYFDAIAKTSIKVVDNPEIFLKFCGSPSSEKFKKDDSLYKAFLKFFKEDEEYSRGYWPNSSFDDLPVRCDIRTNCPSYLVPKEPATERPKYTCEFVIGVGHWGQYTEYYPNPIGLRCHHPDGCICDQTTCPNHALCKEGKCIYDDKYLQNTCGAYYLINTTKDPIIDEADEKRLRQGQLFFNHDYGMTQDIRLSSNGSCICGRSLLKQPDLSKYTCDLVGYRCTDTNGCPCGSLTCKHNSYCIKPDYCSE